MITARILTDNGVKVVSNSLYALNDRNPAMANDLLKFEAIMCEKLLKNSHKDAVFKPDVPRLLELLMGEVGEFVRQYMENKDDPNAEKEAADIANFAFLIYTAVKKC